jgi:hypothetical protein
MRRHQLRVTIELSIVANIGKIISGGGILEKTFGSPGGNNKKSQPIIYTYILSYYYLSLLLSSLVYIIVYLSVPTILVIVAI